MAELKTKVTGASVDDFLEKVVPEQKKQDSWELLRIFKEITGEPAKMWGSSMVGFGEYHYKSERSAQEGDWFLVGFSPRKQNISLYIRQGNEGSAELKNLGEYKEGVGCLYIKELADVDKELLRKLIKRAYEYMKNMHSKLSGEK
jgi:hypothetical protein